MWVRRPGQHQLHRGRVPTAQPPLGLSPAPGSSAPLGRGQGGRAARITGTLSASGPGRGSVSALSLASAGWCAEGLYLLVQQRSDPAPPGEVLPSCLAPQAPTRATLYRVSAGRLPRWRWERGLWRAPPSAHDSACDLASLAAQLCSTDVPHETSPHVPSGRLSPSLPQSAADLTLGLLPRPKLQQPRRTSWGLVALSWVRRAARAGLPCGSQSTKGHRSAPALSMAPASPLP